MAAPDRATGIPAGKASNGAAHSGKAGRACRDARVALGSVDAMRTTIVRAVTAVIALAIGGACGGRSESPAAPSPSPTEGDRYVNDSAYRRAELEASLVNPSNGYSQLRLSHYAGGDARWDALTEWNPRVEPVATGELDDGTAARTSMGATAKALETNASPDDEAAMRALGEAAFFAYPTQLARYAADAVASRAAAESAGLWIDDARDQVGGLVRAELADGSVALAVTCASCHADAGGALLVIGVGSSHLDLGKMIADASGAPADASVRAWGRGRVDVTTSDGSAPERIPDLRPSRWLTHLHQEATLAQRDRTTLAIRIETLIITSHGQGIRPPRLIAWALATYLWSLADSLPSSDPASGAPARGATLFGAQCASCHAQPGLTGPPVALGVVGTDPATGLSSDRGTGMYRVPSLHGVGSRGLLLHDASLPSLDAMFDPTRTTATFAGGTRGQGAVPGHVYGLSLSDSDRADLVAYLKTL